MKELSTMKTDFLRCFRRQWPKTKKAWFSAIVIPALVAVLVWLAFLFQESPGEDFDRFVFFSTLYCFWVGLFNACQTLNGAVESGEWSYWVLGFRRSFLRYFTANVLSVGVGTLVQIAVFFVVLFGLSFFADLGMLEANNILEVGFDSTENALKGFLGCGLFFPEWLPSCLFLSLSFLSAACCGVAFGILLSASIGSSSTALKMSVATVVLIMISSSIVLDEQKNYEYVSEILFENSEGKKLPFAWEDGYFGKTILSGASFAFPQRYFFNVGFCPLHKSVEKEVEQQSSDAWNELRKFGRKGGDEKKLSEIRATCVPEILKMFFSRVFGELFAMTLWCAGVLLFAFGFLKFKSKYYEIR